MAEPALLRAETAGILELTFNRPDKYNAINLEMADGLAQAAVDLRERDDLRLLLIKAKGRYFSAGTDITDISMPDPKGSSSRARTWYRAGRGSFHTMFDELEAIEKPIVVAHQGNCFGGGLELSLSCDFRFAAASASYRMNEIDIGVIPGSGGTSRLTRLVGPHWARWFIMAGELVSAERALAIGLVHNVFPDETFDQQVRAFCEKLANRPPETLAIAKLTIELSADLDRQQARNAERLGNSILFLGDEHRDLIAAMRARLTKSK
jgi:enoyl-CoA hydratase